MPSTSASLSGLFIDRNSKLPLYHQLYEILRDHILSGAWQPGESIPPESELVKQYHVSRTTVRQVLDLLVKEGLIFRQRGRGSFVAHPTVEQGLTRIISFTEDMRRRGLQPGTQVLSVELVGAPPEIAAYLRISPGEELALLKRLRLADGEPMSIEESHLVHRYCPGVLRYDYASQPLRETLECEYGIRLVRARQTIRAIAAPSTIAHLLKVPARAPLLYVERVSYTHGDVPVEYLRYYHRGDRYVLYAELQG
ncbi:MAG: GntR family transcriptional regulator [Anaerolineae bacterium]